MKSIFKYQGDFFQANLTECMHLHVIYFKSGRLWN